MELREIFGKLFKNVLRIPFQKKIPFYVFGDFNIDLHKAGKSNFVTKHVHNLIHLPCKYAIDLSTRKTDHSTRLIQHIYVNDYKHSYIRGVALLDLSDHFGTFVIVIAKSTKSDKAKRHQIRDTVYLNLIMKSSCKTWQMT